MRDLFSTTKPRRSKGGRASNKLVETIDRYLKHVESSVIHLTPDQYARLESAGYIVAGKYRGIAVEVCRDE